MSNVIQLFPEKDYKDETLDRARDILSKNGFSPVILELIMLELGECLEEVLEIKWESAPITYPESLTDEQCAEVTEALKQPTREMTRFYNDRMGMLWDLLVGTVAGRYK